MNTSVLKNQSKSGIFSLTGNKDQFQLKALSFVFILCWLYFFKNATDPKDWWIENILVLLFLFILFITRKQFRFSSLSLLFIFFFLVLHIYGAEGAYTQNRLGLFLRDSLHLARNPYDRIVHFSFGFFMAYPVLDLCKNKLRVNEHILLLFVNMAILCLATIFELIEWGVAAFTDKVTGETYVATQGDPWDAQKDIILALVGSLIVTLFLKVYKNVFMSRSHVLSAKESQ
jgi:putative membrane protein